MSTNKSRRSHNPDQDAYEALSFKGIEQRANYRSVSYRIDMLHVLDKKDAASIVYQIIYRWLEHRRDEILVEIERRRKEGLQPLTAQQVEERMWIYMSYNDFVRETGGAISYNTVIDALNYMVNKKRVLERRANSNPRYSDYEYRISKGEVRKLLAQLPEFPLFVAKGTKGKGQQAVHSTKSGTVSPAADSTKSGIGSTKSGIGSTENGIGSTETGRELYQNWGTSQKKTQNLPQDSSQGIPQQQQSAHPLPSQEAVAAALSILGNLSEEEIALVVAHRQQTTGETPQPLGEMPPAAAAPSEQAEIITQANGQREEEALEIVPALPRPASDASLTDEVIVSLYEYKHSCRYEKEDRPFQLQAARSLLGLRLALSVDLLELVYDECCDQWWREHYGELHVSHLVEKEKSHGQRRIVRLMKRVESRGQVAANTNGTGEATASTPMGGQPRMVMWKGRQVPEEQAEKEGYEGGFERFKKGEHPDDDLEATLKRLQAEGRLPVFEGVSNNG